MATTLLVFGGKGWIGQQLMGFLNKSFIIVHSKCRADNELDVINGPRFTSLLQCSSCG